MISRPHKGFTLIELLVVVAIVSLIISIVMVSLNAAQMRARDSKRTSDLSQVIKALELYRANNEIFPPHGGPQFGCPSANCLSVLTDDLVPTYLPSIPVDPRTGNTSTGYRYCRADAPRDGYQIIVRLEKNASFCTVRTSSGITGAGTSCWTTNEIPDLPYCD